MEEERDEGTTEERWRAVVNFKGLYEISDFGNVKRVGKATGATVGRILKPWPDKDGYYYVVLTRPGERYTARIHRLVAGAFIGPRPEGLQVNHIDGIKTNNRADNLEYVTASENQIHAQMLGLCRSTRGENNGASKLKECDIPVIMELLLEKTGRAIAAMFNVSPATICLIASGKLWGWLKEDEDDERT